MAQTHSTLLPRAGLLLAMILWSSSFIALKLAFRSYHPMVVIFGRMAVATLCFLFFIPGFSGLRYRKGDFKYFLFMAVCEPCLYFLLEAKALENTTASQAGMICAMLPLMVSIAAAVFLKERMARKTLIGFLLAIGGAFWLSLGGKPMQQAPNPPLGNFFEFLAMVCATGYMITLKRLTYRYSPVFLTAVQAWTGCLFYLMFLFLPSTDLPDRFEPVGGLAIIYLGTVITLGAYGLYNYGTSRIPASQASAFINLIPVFTIILGWIILGERFTPMQYPASLLVFVGIFISQEKPGGKKRKSPCRIRDNG